MTPRATYRIQFGPSFGFGEAAGLAPYLSALGISHVYAAPVFAARPGSSHGYDVVDPTRLNPELGGESGVPRDGGRLSPPRPGAHPRHRPQPHGDRRRQQSLLARRAALGSAQPLCALVRYRLEPPGPAPRGQGARSRSSARAIGRRSTMGALELRFDPIEGGFAVWAHDTHKLPVCPRSYGRILRAGGFDRAGSCGGGLERGRPRRSRLGVARPSARRQRRRRRRRRPVPSTVAPTIRHPGTGSMRLSPCNSGAPPSSAWRMRQSTTAASSPSATSPAFVWRTRRSSRRRMR